MSEWAKNAAAFKRLAVTQRRLSLQARMKAAEAETADDAKFWRGEAKRLWNDAAWHDAEALHHEQLGARHGA